MSGNERSCILNRVQQAGFAVDEVVLYLDTHPCDSKALAFYQKARDEQKRAVCEYNAKIGPLTNDMVEPANRLVLDRLPLAVGKGGELLNVEL